MKKVIPQAVDTRNSQSKSRYNGHAKMEMGKKLGGLGSQSEGMVSPVEGPRCSHPYPGCSLGVRTRVREGEGG